MRSVNFREISFLSPCFVIVIFWSVIVSVVLAIGWPIVQSGTNAGKEVFGQDPLWLAWVTEPLEFMFMFCALPLYVVYAILQGCAFAPYLEDVKISHW